MCMMHKEISVPKVKVCNDSRMTLERVGVSSDKSEIMSLTGPDSVESLTMQTFHCYNVYR